MLTSLAWAAICGYEELFEYLVFDVGHDDDELSRVSSSLPPLHTFLVDLNADGPQ
jgi:hypothetical protein